jgi:hypothetical protein
MSLSDGASRKGGDAGTVSNGSEGAGQ